MSKDKDDKDGKSDKSDKDDKDDKSDKSKKSDKPLIISRVLAFLIDSFFVMLLASLIVSPFMNSKELSSLMNETTSVLEKYQKSEITIQQYNVELSNIQYKMSKSMELVNIVRLLFGVIFFVVYPLYHNGQTLGKRIVKIKVISTAGELSANQLLFRSFIANAILLDVISILFLMFASRNVYTSCVELFTMIQHIIMIVSFFMISFDKEGLTIHDRLVHTRVVNVSK